MPRRIEVRQYIPMGLIALSEVRPEWPRRTDLLWRELLQQLMNHSNLELLPIGLGHVVFQAPLGDASSDNPAGFDINHVKHGSPIFIRFDRLS